MYRLDAFQFIEAVRIIGRIDGIFFAVDRAEGNPKKTDKMSDVAKKGGKDRNDALIALLTDLKLPVTLAQRSGYQRNLTTRLSPSSGKIFLSLTSTSLRA